MSDWQPIETAPKDGTRILFGGRFLAFDINTGGQWTEEIFAWSTLSSNPNDSNSYQWIGAQFCSPEQWHVEWTHWMPLPDPPQQKAPTQNTGE